jgi:uncharacterized protein YbgA (DUF1722 family)/uncharacterized protein YbbK (DUF523 family)
VEGIRVKGTYIKPVVVISKCIEHGHCRYDGSQIGSGFIKRIKPYVDFIPICPEVAIGLTVPREAIRIIKEKDDHKLVYSLTGKEITESMVEFTEEYLKSLEDKTIHGFVLKNRSPSCGINDVKVYKSHGKSQSIGKTGGFFGGQVLDKFGNMAIEDEGRLTNYNIRDHFLTRIFMMASYDLVIEANHMKALIDFHSHNKYLLMSYHQKNQKLLGKIVANHEKKPVNEVIMAYKSLLELSLKNPLKRGTNINMLMHLLGYFKDNLAKEEKAYFLDVLEQYSQKKVPFSVPISVIKAWVIRFQEPYLKDQTIFEPYPKDILDVTDSGKGID